MSELAFLSPERCSPGVALEAALGDLDTGGVVTELDGLGKLEIRGERAALERQLGEPLLPLGSGRALLVTAGAVGPAAERIVGLGHRVYDLSAALVALEFAGPALLQRLTPLPPRELPAAAPVAREVRALIEARPQGRFRVYVARELARFVAEVIVDLSRGLP